MRLRLALIFLSGFLAFAACTSSTHKTDVNEKEVVKIGIVLPLTGDLGNFGKTVLNGINLAKSQSLSNDTKHQVQLFIEDSRGDPTTAVSATNKLITIDKVNIIIGSLTSGETLAMNAVTERNKVLLLSPTASSASLSTVGKYFYRIWTSDNYDGEIAARYCYDSLKAKTASIIYLNNDYCLGLETVFEKTFLKLNGKILSSDSYEETNTNFTTLLSKIKVKNPDVVYIPGYPQGIALTVKQAKEINLKPIFFSNVSSEDKDFITLAGNSADKLFYTAPSFNTSSSEKIVQNFLFKYKSQYKEVPDIHAAKGYDVMNIILKGIKTNHTTTDDLKSYIDSTKIFDTLTGRLIFHGSNVVTNISIKQYQNNSIRIISVIKPQ